MDNRIYKFVNKTYGVAYMVTKEELDVLNTSYNHQEYCEFRQNIHNNVCYLADNKTDLLTEADVLTDDKHNTEEEVLGNMLIQDLLNLLTDRERMVVMRLIIEKYKLKELEDEMQMTRQSIQRMREKALNKMKAYLETMGISSFQDVVNELLH